MIELKPCPFCRESSESKVFVGGNNVEHFVMCWGCGGAGPTRGTEAEAAAAWNDRPAPAAKGLVWEERSYGFAATSFDGVVYDLWKVADGLYTVPMGVGRPRLAEWVGIDAAKAAAEAHHQAAAAELWKEWWGHA